jgi:hypothetical protein
MAKGDRILYSHNAYLAGIISSEATTRATNDNSIQTNINTTKSTLASVQVTAAGINQSITNEHSAMLAQVGDLDFGGLTWNDAGTPRVPQSITKAINALNTLSLANEAAVGATGGANLVSAETVIDAKQIIASSDATRIANILALSTSDKNSFIELLTLANNNDSDAANALATCQSAINAIAGTKTEQIQTINTTMHYTDKTTGKNYKLVISSGNLVLIEL